MIAARIPSFKSITVDSTRSTLVGKAPLDSTTASKGTSEEASSTIWGLLRLEWELLSLSTAIKLLLFPTYHSTDFEVHRNWLAITRTLPIREWYFEATSQWTLDYPPFFAYFSWILAQPAPFIDPLIVSLHEGIEYAAWSCKAYMRTTVVATELVLAAALLAHARLGAQRAIKIGYVDDVTISGIKTSQLLALSLLMHPGLIIIDHIHFQYNGFLFGVLAWSLWAAREDKPLWCAFLFSSLLNLKHIYIYVAPPFLIFLLRCYVLPIGTQPSDLGRSGERLITVGVVTLVPFILSLAPLAIDGLRHETGPIGVLSQMVSRLFPFSRGLIHAYWAPNAWALWTFADRILVKLLPRIPALRAVLPASFLARYDAAASTTGFVSASRGLVENISFGLLPEVSPSMCFILTLTCMSVYMVKLWQTPTYRSFLASVSLCGFASFLFGWHVHEKAIMLPLIPYTFLAADDYHHFRTFVLLSTAGIVSLFPLLFTPEEAPIKIGYSIVWGIVIFGTLQKRVFRPVQSNTGILVHKLETLYLWGFLVLQVYVSIVHPMVFSNRDGQGRSAQARVAAEVRTNLIDKQFGIRENVKAVVMDVNRFSPAAPAVPAATAADTEAVLASIVAETAAATNAPQVESNEEGGKETCIHPELSISTAEFDAAQPGPTNDADLLSVSSTQDAQMDATTRTQMLESKDQAEPAVDTNAVEQERDPASAAGSSSSLSSSMEFLPLMMVSVYCSIGVIWAWMRASALYLLTET